MRMSEKCRNINSDNLLTSGHTDGGKKKGKYFQNLILIDMLGAKLIWRSSCLIAGRDCCWAMLTYLGLNFFFQKIQKKKDIFINF